jgi:uncharacterized membrane protein
MRTLVAIFTSRSYLILLTGLSVFWMIMNSLSITGHFDPYPFHLLSYALAFIAFAMIAAGIWQSRQETKMLRDQFGAHVKTWDKIAWLEAQIEQVQAEIKRLQQMMTDLQEDHGRVVSIVFDLQNMETASKNQHHMLNDRLISIAKEIESLVELTVALKDLLKTSRGKIW